MWPLGHIGIAYILYTLFTRWNSEDIPAKRPAIVAVFGGLFPDLVDKPLAWWVDVLPSGRTLAHSLLVLVPLCVLVYAVGRWYGRSEYGIAFAIGALSHSVVDAIPSLWRDDVSASFLLWPYRSVETYEGASPTILELFITSLSDPYFLTEFVFLGIAIVLWYSHRETWQTEE